MSPHILLKQLEADEDIPYDLLLLADPSKEMVERYLAHSQLYIASQAGVTVGVVVLMAREDKGIEIKSIAVEPELQGRGIGQLLLQKAIEEARQKQYKSICIGTANSSVGQLYLYQKLGFEIEEIYKNFFVDHYPSPIFEKGIQAKHMLMLYMQL